MNDPKTSPPPQPRKAEAAPYHRGPAHSSPYPVSRLAGPIDLVETAREIAAA